MTAVKNQVHDAILTVMDNVLTPTVDMTLRSITESSGQGPSSMVQSYDQRDFSGNTENTQLMLASSRVNLNID